MQTFDGERHSRRLRFPRRWSTRLALVAALLAALAVPAAWASDRFADVPDSNPHHDDINTIARAAITQGCNPPANTLYCPGDPVSRQQMGSFLARTLRALTPATFTATGSGALDPDASPVVCQTGPFGTTLEAKGPYYVTVSLKQQGAGELGYSIQPVLSTDGGATWSGHPQVMSYETSTSDGAWSNASSSLNVFTGPPPSDQFRLGVRVARESGTADASDSRCRLSALLAYRDAGVLNPPWLVP